MKGKNKTFELTLYEFLGVTYFKKKLLEFIELFFKLFSRLSHIPFNKSMLSGSNYYLNKDKGKNAPKEFKKMIWFNACIHIISFTAYVGKIISSASIQGIIMGTIWLVLNVYCLMLQRYNYIRINQLIKKQKLLEQKREERRHLENENTITLTPLSPIEQKRVFLDEMKNNLITCFDNGFAPEELVENKNDSNYLVLKL